MIDKLLIICGPTATGKTDLGIYLSQKFDGEVISADSRQVYKGMDIISGKDIDIKSKLIIKNQELEIKNKNFSVGYRLNSGISIWLVDIVKPDYPFNVGEYARLSHRIIENIGKRKKLPIIVGGTGLYIKSLIEPLTNIYIPPNNKLRRKLYKMSKEELVNYLEKIDPYKLSLMNQSDRLNPRRLIRSIEIAEFMSQKSLKTDDFSNKSYNFLLIGLKASKDILIKLINNRVEKRLTEGALAEVKNLVKKRYKSSLPSLSATGFQDLKDFIDKKSSLDKAIKKWQTAEGNYAKRQITWFKKMHTIHWFDINDKNYIEKIGEVVQKWYTSNA